MTVVRPSVRCPPPPDPRLHGLPADIDTALWIRLDSIAQALYDPMGGILGAYVVRTRDSQLVWSRHPDLRTLPASTMKVFAAAAALEDLGPEFRWKTQVWATGPVVKGTLKGNLVLEGGGDPTLGTDGAGMGPLVNAVARAGIKRVEGSLVALDTLVGRELDVWPQGWSIGNARDGYGAPVVGLNWGQNRSRYRSFPEPRKLALLTFSKSLKARRIAVAGTDTTILARGDTVLDRRKWTLVGKVQSPKLSEVLRICLVHSVNQYAEASILAIGARRPSPKYSPRDQGRRRFRQILTSMGVPSSVTADDGSGLSRHDLVTARAMANLLRRDLRRADGLRIVDLMPKGGQGTLRYRFGRLPSPSWVSAKTGTLDGTSCLVGILRVPGRDTLAFALLSSGYQGTARKVRGFQDRMLVALAGVDQRTVVDTVPAADSLDEQDELIPDSLPLQPASVHPDTVPAAPAALDDTTSTPSIPPSPDTVVPVVPDTASRSLPEAVVADSIQTVPGPHPADTLAPVHPIASDTADPALPAVPDTAIPNAPVPPPVAVPSTLQETPPDGAPPPSSSEPLPAPVPEDIAAPVQAPRDTIESR